MDISIILLAVFSLLVALPIGWRRGTVFTSLACGFLFGIAAFYLAARGFLPSIGAVIMNWQLSTWLAVALVSGLGAWVPAWFFSPADTAFVAQPSRPTVRLEDKATKPTTSLFLSYRRSDSRDITGRIYDRLIHEFGRTAVFRDVDSIPIGTDFRQHIDGMLTRCNVCLVVIGSDWQTARDDKGNARLLDPRDHVRIEIETALKRNIPVIPVLVAGASIPSSSELPDTLQDLAFRNAIHVRSDPDFHRDVDRLLAGLNELKA